MARFLGFCIILSLAFLGCSQKKEVTFEVPVRTPGEPDALTQEMIERVRKAVARIDVKDVDYILNNKKVELIKAEIPKASGIKKIGLNFSYALELMNSGKTEESIQTLNQVMDEVLQRDFARQEKLVFTLKKQLAIAWMRLAEQQNCIANHNEESCIIPISPKAQHVLREGAEMSIKMLNEALAMRPEDQECQYLLNVAHMTLGQYPDQVPTNYLIPESYFQGSVTFPRFTDIAMPLGIDMNAGAGGTCVGDFNNDGYLDIIASSWGFEDQIQYYENDRKGGFVQKTNPAGLKGVTGGLNLRHADYNNDGHLDFIILRGAWLLQYGGIPNSLFRNNGDGTFTDVTISSKLYSMHPTQTAVWADFNLDGWLDIFIANESGTSSPNPSELYLNQADGTFREMAEEAGIEARGYFKGVAVGDVNNDRYPDLYLSNLTGNNTLYLNQGQNDVPSFISAGRKAGVSGPYRSFPTWIFDFDQDGWDDLFVSSYASKDDTPAELMIESVLNKRSKLTPVLYRNKGDGTFEDISKQVGLTEPASTMGCNFGDLDNDGFLDFYLATGDPEYYSIVPNKMYRNNAGKSYEDVTYSGGFGHIQKGHAIGFGDFDFDGDQDIYAVMGGAFEGDVFRNLLFENPIGNQTNWINIQLVGIESNRSAIGAKLILTLDSDRKIYHTVGMDASFGGNSLMAELGLGKAESIKKLEILWPHESMEISEFEDLSVNQTIKIIEGNDKMQKLNFAATPFKKKRMHGHHMSDMNSKKCELSKEMYRIMEFMQEREFNVDPVPQTEPLVFISYDSLLNEKSQLPYEAIRYNTVRFKSKEETGDQLYSRFRMDEICFESSSSATDAERLILALINSSDSMNDKIYDYLIRNEDRLIYVSCDVKAFEELIMDLKSNFEMIVEGHWPPNSG